MCQWICANDVHAKWIDEKGAMYINMYNLLDVSFTSTDLIFYYLKEMVTCSGRLLPEQKSIIPISSLYCVNSTLPYLWTPVQSFNIDIYLPLCLSYLCSSFDFGMCFEMLRYIMYIEVNANSYKRRKRSDEWKASGQYLELLSIINQSYWNFIIVINVDKKKGSELEQTESGMFFSYCIVIGPRCPWGPIYGSWSL